MLNLTVTPPPGGSGFPIPKGPPPPTRAERLRDLWLNLKYTWEDLKIRAITWWM